MAKNWTTHEVKLAVADYVNMLILEHRGAKYNKSATRRALMKKLDGRSAGSVERKRMNISAALLDIGIPCIEGYKLYNNYQSIISNVIDQYLAKTPALRNALDQSACQPVSIPAVEDILSTLVDPPNKQTEAVKSSHNSKRKSPMGVNYLQIDASNRELGDAGEEFVLGFEKARLIRDGKNSLADQIEHVALTVGPSAGYDIRSYNKNGTDRFVEVKTTKYGIRTPFYITPHEVEFSAK